MPVMDYELLLSEPFHHRHVIEDLPAMVQDILSDSRGTPIYRLRQTGCNFWLPLCKPGLSSSATKELVSI
jgi:hypothetical protein